jgi:hypothetical protein
MRQVSETTGTAPRLWGSAASLFGMLGVAAALTIAFNLGRYSATAPEPAPPVSPPSDPSTLPRLQVLAVDQDTDFMPPIEDEPASGAQKPPPAPGPRGVADERGPAASPENGGLGRV